MSVGNTAKDLVEALKGGKSPSAYDTPATVTRIDEGILWVHIPGGVEETPIKRTIGASVGDEVQVRISNGQAWVVGNASAPPTDDTRANYAVNLAAEAIENANIAHNAATSAQKSAIEAATAAATAQTSADNAATAAATAQTSADNAATAAATADSKAVQAATAAATADSKAVQAATAAATADAKAVAAQTSADNAATAAATAQTSADNAATAASAAQTSADNASTAAATADSKAVQAATAAATADAKAVEAQNSATAAATAASSAQTSADNAMTAANSATASANTALTQLSTVEDVVGTLNWISEHGTYKATTDTEVVSGKLYFTRTGSGTEADPYEYSVVTNPTGNPSTSVYFELDSVDEAVSNYVASHLALTDEGLYMINDQNGWRVLIKNDGFYIIDDHGVTVAQYKDAVTIGEEEKTHVNVDYHSLQLVDKEGSTYFHVSDLRNETGYATMENQFVGDGSTKRFGLALQCYQVITVTINNATVSTSDYSLDTSRYYVVFTNAPASSDTISVTYKSSTSQAKAFTFGKRGTGTVGAYSYAEGYSNVAGGSYSHAEGHYTKASNESSHAEGYDTTASGYYSHAEGYGTTASGRSSHAEGENTTASDNSCHAEGYRTTSNGYGSHAEGEYTSSSSWGSHAEGFGTSARGYASHAEGYYTTAASNYQHVGGQYNVSDTNFKYAEIIGNGTSNSARSNARTLDWEGNEQLAGNSTISKPIMDVTASSISAKQTASFGVIDKNDTYVAWFDTDQYTNGATQAAVVVRNKASGSDVTNGIYLGVGADGTRTVSVGNSADAKAAWRSALGVSAIQSKTVTGTTDANGFITLSLANGSYIPLVARSSHSDDHVEFTSGSTSWWGRVTNRGVARVNTSVTIDVYYTNKP